jgi:thiosulfate dehydrogenase
MTSHRPSRAIVVASASAAVLMALVLLITVAAAQQPAAVPKANPAKAFITGMPSDPTEPWALAYGGRLYDTWWLVLGENPPAEQNPAYPKAGSATGADTWTCTACHGWDYKGVNGVSAHGENFTGVKGVEGAKGRAPAEIVALLRASPHNYTPAMIPDDALGRLALFINKGLYDTNTYIEPSTRHVSGDIAHGFES